LSPTEELIAQVQAAGGTLTIDADGDERKLTRVDAQVLAILRFRKLPLGQILRVETPNWRKRVVTIEPQPDWISDGASSIPVPAQVRNPHPAVATLRDTDGLLAVSRSSRTRAVRILQALVTAATAHGYTVSSPSRAAGRYGREQSDPAQIRFDVRGHSIGLRITQENDRSEHVPTARELAAQKRSPRPISRYTTTRPRNG
jgi:hypothetical protein